MKTTMGGEANQYPVICRLQRQRRGRSGLSANPRESRSSTRSLTGFSDRGGDRIRAGIRKLRTALLALTLSAISVWEGRTGELDSWSVTPVPAASEVQGFVWYRACVEVPESWRGSRLLLTAGRIDEVDEAYFNGERIGANGSLPPLFALPASRVRRPYVIEPDQIRYGQGNLISWRIYSRKPEGGIIAGPVRLSRLTDAVDLTGGWLSRQGDRSVWTDWLYSDPETETQEFRNRLGDSPSAFGRIVEVDQAEREAANEAVRGRYLARVGEGERTGPEPLTPAEALNTFETAEGLRVDPVLHESLIRQPLFVDFDERGRLWLVQYRQYPDPAGLQVLTWDDHLRKVFDRVPPPPPYDRPGKESFWGRDRISYHEDTDGDGIYDRHGVFVEGLNLATSLAFGRGGLWVLQPPYLLFYPDADGDDRPDGEPETHLAGFGLEDTHSIANSLKWGPDGWLYGAVGSTVTARVRVVGSNDPRHWRFFGQNVWRYHPETRRFELFAEGGWNTFGLEFDDQGRLFSGTNGNLQAVRFVQGGFYRKSFGKHGPFTRSYTFGHFNGLPIQGQKLRLVHQWLPYSSGAMATLQGRLIGGNALAHRLHALRLEPEGSSFRTVELPAPLRSSDRWFRPVHLAVGPSGAVYISDWYDARITHLDPRDNWDRERGRVWRLRSEHAAFAAPENLGALSSVELVDRLRTTNQWVRATARRLLRERRDESVLPLVRDGMAQDGQFALECLWSLHALDAFDAGAALSGLTHDLPAIRVWTLRLLGDSRRSLSLPVWEAVRRTAKDDTSPEVVSQAASLAARLSPDRSWDLLRILASRPFTEDPNIPLQLWWACEAQIRRDPERVTGWLSDPALWNEPMFASALIERLGRRFMADRSERHLAICARLLRLAPDRDALRRLLRGMEQALDGREFSHPPAVLEPALEQVRLRLAFDTEFIAFALRLGSRAGVRAAQDYVRNPDGRLEKRLELLRGLARRLDPEMRDYCLSLFSKPQESNPFRIEAIGNLRYYAEGRVADKLLSELAGGDPALRPTALAVLTGRPSWAKRLLQAIERQTVPSEILDRQVLLTLSRLPGLAGDSFLKQLLAGRRATGALPPQEGILRVRRLLAADEGDPQRGRELFESLCGNCHRLFDSGRAVGPDLTGYERGNREYLLTAVADPNLAVREEFELVTVTLRPASEGEEAVVLSGFVRETDDGGLELRDLAGNRIAVGADDIAGTQRSRQSVMPEGLLDGLDARQLRDLFAFVQHPGETFGQRP